MGDRSIVSGRAWVWLASRELGQVFRIAWVTSPHISKGLLPIKPFWKLFTAKLPAKKLTHPTEGIRLVNDVHKLAVKLGKFYRHQNDNGYLFGSHESLLFPGPVDRRTTGHKNSSLWGTHLYFHWSFYWESSWRLEQNLTFKNSLLPPFPNNVKTCSKARFHAINSITLLGTRFRTSSSQGPRPFGRLPKRFGKSSGTRSLTPDV